MKPIILESTESGYMPGCRPYTVVLMQWGPCEYAVNRQYLDDIGGYGNGSYFPYRYTAQYTALQNALDAFKARCERDGVNWETIP